MASTAGEVASLFGRRTTRPALDAVPTYRLDIAYDGSAFHGFARQAAVRTIQGEIERVISTVTHQDVDSTGAGRTDAGVHARHQVISFTTEDGIDSDRLGRSITRMLGPEVVCTQCVVAEPDFDARFSAVGRAYRYRVLDTPQPDPLRRFTTWHVPWPLDIGRMNVAMAHLVGEHDFASFCRRREGATTIRTVTAAEWTRDEDMAVLRIEARAFCHQMVRSIVGLSVDAGRGRLDPDEVPGIMAAHDRSQAPQIAPPYGLILWEVRY